MFNGEIKVLNDYISKFNKIVFFGGAGVSTASGIPDFRSTNGIYNQKYANSPEVILSHTFFKRHPKEFFAFYKEMMIHPDVLPNVVHLRLVELERLGKLSSIITQNIDGLHQRAGSQKVIELHGSVWRNYCLKCHMFYPLDVIISSSEIPKCTCGGVIKPDVVLYEEGLDGENISQAIKDITQAELLIVGGTSLKVYPAASFINYCDNGKIVIINKDVTSYDHLADLVINGDLTEVFEKIKI